MLRCSGLNRLVLLFSPTAHLREGERGRGRKGGWRGLAFPTPARGPCPWNQHRGDGTHHRAQVAPLRTHKPRETGDPAGSAPHQAALLRNNSFHACGTFGRGAHGQGTHSRGCQRVSPIRLLLTGLRLRRGRRCAAPYVRRGSALLP